TGRRWVRRACRLVEGGSSGTTGGHVVATELRPSAGHACPTLGVRSGREPVAARSLRRRVVAARPGPEPLLAAWPGRELAVAGRCGRESVLGPLPGRFLVVRFGCRRPTVHARLARRSRPAADVILRRGNSAGRGYGRACGNGGAAAGVAVAVAAVHRRRLLLRRRRDPAGPA
ncbi:MAG TPA: hypothetical protein VF462_04095, partial [Micromonosporaceae bacterium]